MKIRLRELNLNPLLPIMAVSLVVRLPGLVSRPLWYDEAFSVLLSSKGPTAVVRATVALEGGVAAEPHPIFYYIIIWAWERLFGTTPLSVRSLSLILALCLVACGYLLARRVFDSRTAILAGYFLAFSPFQVHYSQETWMYSLMALLLLGATIVYWEALHGRRIRNWPAFSLLAAAAQYAHNLSFAFLLPLSLTPVLLLRWRDALRTAIAGLIAVLIYSPWLTLLPSQMARIERAYWIARPGAEDLVRTLLVFLSGLPVPQWPLPVVVACAVLILAVGVWSTVRRLIAGASGARRGVWLAYLAAAPVGIMFVVSQWWPVYLDRAMLAAGTVFLLWLAWVLGSRRPSNVLVAISRAAVVFAFALGLMGFYTYRGLPYAPYAELDQFLRERTAPGEVILHSNKITALPAIYYDPGLEQGYLADPPGAGSDTLARAT